MILSGGTGKTIQGDVSAGALKTKYASISPIASDTGAHPQNLFRLMTKAEWLNSSEQLYLKVNKDNLSNPTNRLAYNGLSLLNRYKDGNTYYVSTLPMEGKATINKKLN
jgi:hypothetical protein